MATQEHGNETAAGEVGPAKAKKATSPVRTVIGLVLVVVLGTVAFLEFTANRGFNDAVTALNQALEKEDGGLLSDKQVEEMAKKAPDGPAVKEGNINKVTYTWSGVFRKHRFAAYYNNEKTPHLLRISTD